ncbi:unnamed protein product [Phytophthora lilii]|uniref:Unnamed protein product n=1 Tax=Phytophthora lilii TaxID=2077276 RepID=A0A9W6WQL3_9STRA|nr:unnamed protein product [Phytophthora lilii]
MLDKSIIFGFQKLKPDLQHNASEGPTGAEPSSSSIGPLASNSVKTTSKDMKVSESHKIFKKSILDIKRQIDSMAASIKRLEDYAQAGGDINCKCQLAVRAPIVPSIRTRQGKQSTRCWKDTSAFDKKKNLSSNQLKPRLKTRNLESVFTGESNEDDSSVWGLQNDRLAQPAQVLPRTSKTESRDPVVISKALIDLHQQLAVTPNDESSIQNLKDACDTKLQFIQHPTAGTYSIAFEKQRSNFRNPGGICVDTYCTGTTESHPKADEKSVKPPGPSVEDIYCLSNRASIDANQNA